MRLSEKIRILRDRLVGDGILRAEYRSLRNSAIQLERELKMWKEAPVWRPPGRPNTAVVMGTRGLEIWEDGELRLTIL